MHLSTKSRYAVMALVDLATEKQKPVSLSNLAQRQNLPLPYLEQLFLKLKKAGLVKSIRGSLGGYDLTKDPDKISIFDIVRAVGSPFSTTRCGISSVGCLNNGSKCQTHNLWRDLDATLYNYFKSKTLYNVSIGDLSETLA